MKQLTPQFGVVESCGESHQEYIVCDEILLNRVRNIDEDDIPTFLFQQYSNHAIHKPIPVCGSADKSTMLEIEAL